MGQGENSTQAQVTCDRSNLIKVKKSLEEKGFFVEKSEVALIPNQIVSDLEGEDLENFNKMIEIFEENEDVQGVDHNYVPDYKDSE